MANMDLQYLKLSGEGSATLLITLAAGEYHQPIRDEFDQSDWRKEKLTGLRWQWFDGDDNIDCENNKMMFTTANEPPVAWFLAVAREFPKVTMELLSCPESCSDKMSLH